MIDLGPSTNKGVALLKLLHRLEDSPLINDDYIRWFLSESQLSQISELPQMPALPPSDPDDLLLWNAYWYTVLRERFVDDQIVLTLRDRFSQVVNLGAGYDTRFFRLFESVHPPIETFEIDLPQTIDDKSRCIAAARGHIPPSLHLLSMDLEDFRLSELTNHGFDPKAPTIYLLQGVLYYLSAEAAIRLVREVVSAGPGPAKLICDGCYPQMTYANDAIPGIRSQTAKLKQIGEPYRFGEDPSIAAGRLRDLGCTHVEVVAMKELELKYRKTTQLRNDMWYVVMAEVKT